MGHLTRFDTWTTFTTTVTKTLEYTLLALTLTEKYRNTIMALVLTGGRNILRDSVYTPVKHQAIGINKLYITQGVLHINEVLNHIWRRTQTGETDTDLH